MAPMTPELAAFDAWRRQVLRGAAGTLPISDQLAAFDAWRQKMLRGAAGPMTGVMPSQTPLGQFDTWRQGLLRGAAGPMPGSPLAPPSPPATVATVATAPQAAQQAAAARAPGAGTIMGKANAPTGTAGMAGMAGQAPNPYASIASRNAIRYPAVAPSAVAPSAVSAAGGLVDDAAGLAGGAAMSGRAAAMANLRNGALPWFSAGKAPARVVQLGGMKGVSGAGGIALTGLMAGGLVDGLNIGGEGSQLDSTLTNATKGAALGAAAGSVVPVLGTAVGGLLGAGGGALYGAFKKNTDPLKAFGDEAVKQAATLGQIADAYGLDPQSRAELMQQFSADLKTVAALGGKKPDRNAISAIVQTYASQIPAVRQQASTMSQAAHQAVAMQQAIGSYMQPFLDNARAQSTLAADTYQSLADRYAAQPTGAYYGSMAANERSYGAKNEQGWAGAMQLIPTVNALAAAQQYAQTPRVTFQSALGGGMGALPTATR